MIDLALQRVDKNFSGIWADLGTGAGALSIALAKRGNKVNIVEKNANSNIKNNRFYSLSGKTKKYLEIIFGSDDKNLYVIDWEGNLLSNYFAGGKIQSSPIVDDLDNNGILEIVFGSNNGNLYAVNFKENSLIDLPGWPIELGSSPIKSSPVSFDLNNNGIAEVISSSSEGILFAVEFDGRITPNFPVNNFGSNESSFSIDDIDGDGDPEIAGVSSTKLAVIDVKTQYGLG